MFCSGPRLVKYLVKDSRRLLGFGRLLLNASNDRSNSEDSYLFQRAFEHLNRGVDSTDLASHVKILLNSKISNDDVVKQKDALLWKVINGNQEWKFETLMENLLPFSYQLYQFPSDSIKAFWEKNVFAKLDQIEPKTIQKYLKPLAFLSYYCQLKSPKMMGLFEQEIKSKYSQLSPDEIGLFCASFFRTKSGLHHLESVIKILLTIGRNASQISEAYPLVSVSKCLEFSVNNFPEFYNYNVRIHRTLSAVLNSLVKNAPALSNVENQARLLKFLFTARFVDQSFVRLISETIQKSDLTSLRIKTLGMLYFNYMAAGFVERSEEQVRAKLIQEIKHRLKDDMNVWKHPHWILLICTSMAMEGVFIPEVLNQVFSKQFLSTVNSSNRRFLSSQMYHLHRCMETDFNQYSGMRLQPSALANLREQHRIHKEEQARSTAVAFTKHIYSQIGNVLETVLGNRDLYDCRPILDHFDAFDFEIRLNSSNQPIPVRSWSTEQLCRKVAIVPLLPGSFLTMFDWRRRRHYRLVSSLNRMKKRHLEKSNYNVIMMPHFTFYKLLKTGNANENIRELIFKRGSSKATSPTYMLYHIKPFYPQNWTYEEYLQLGGHGLPSDK